MSYDFTADIGRTARLTFPVSTRDTAASVGSGVVQVLGTPILIAWLEATTLQVLEVPAGDVSVGVRVEVDHLAASPVGADVRCSATLVAAAGARLTFRVDAFDLASEREVARGTIIRAVVNLARFQQQH